MAETSGYIHINQPLGYEHTVYYMITCQICGHQYSSNSSHNCIIWQKDFSNPYSQPPVPSMPPLTQPFNPMEAPSHLIEDKVADITRTKYAVQEAFAKHMLGQTGLEPFDLVLCEQSKFDDGMYTTRYWFEKKVK